VLPCVPHDPPPHQTPIGVSSSFPSPMSDPQWGFQLGWFPVFSFPPWNVSGVSGAPADSTTTGSPHVVVDQLSKFGGSAFSRHCPPSLLAASDPPFLGSPLAASTPGLHLIFPWLKSPPLPRQTLFFVLPIFPSQIILGHCKDTPHPSLEPTPPWVPRCFCFKVMRPRPFFQVSSVLAPPPEGAHDSQVFFGPSA